MLSARSDNMSDYEGNPIGLVAQGYDVRFVQDGPRIDRVLGLHMYSESFLESNCFIFKGINNHDIQGVWSLLSHVGLSCLNTNPLFIGTCMCCSLFDSAPVWWWWPCVCLSVLVSVSF